MREEVERTKALDPAHDRPDLTNYDTAQASATTKHHHNLCAKHLHKIKFH